MEVRIREILSVLLEEGTVGSYSWRCFRDYEQRFLADLPDTNLLLAAQPGCSMRYGVVRRRLSLALMVLELLVACFRQYFPSASSFGLFLPNDGDKTGI